MYIYIFWGKSKHTRARADTHNILYACMSPELRTYKYGDISSKTVRGGGIAQWLERRTRDWKVAGSNPCWNGGRIFFSRVDFLCWLLFRYPFHPRVTTVARKKSRSFCQKCRWQVTAKHAYTLHIEPCFGIGHNLSLICQMTSEDIKHQLIIIKNSCYIYCLILYTCMFPFRLKRLMLQKGKSKCLSWHSRDNISGAWSQIRPGKHCST